VAECVVELLEAVDVDDQECQRLVTGTGTGQVGAQLPAELAAVGKAGELVRRGLAARLVEAADLAHGERGPGHRGEHRSPGERDRDGRDVREPRGDEQRERRDGEEEGRHQHAQVPGIDLARLLDRLPARERHDHERDDPQRVEHRARRVRVGGEAREVERVGEGEEPEARRQQRPGPPAAPSVQDEHRDGEAEQQEIRERVRGIRQDGRAAPLRACEDRRHDEADADGAHREDPDEAVEPGASREIAGACTQAQADTEVGARVEGEPAGVGRGREGRLVHVVEDESPPQVADRPQHDRRQQRLAPRRAAGPGPHRDDRAGAGEHDVLAPGVEQLVGRVAAEPELRVGDVDRQQREHQPGGARHGALGAARDSREIGQQEAQEDHLSAASTITQVALSTSGRSAV
jgi:hypothetical protein